MNPSSGRAAFARGGPTAADRASATEKAATEAPAGAMIADDDEMLLRGLIGGPGKVLYRVKLTGN